MINAGGKDDLDNDVVLVLLLLLLLLWWSRACSDWL
jgi:hypothetical protein